MTPDRQRISGWGPDASPSPAGQSTLSPFPVRGAIEGFYGTFYTFPERNDLIAFLGQNGFNFYLYGPKNDRQHRKRWWEPYPPAVLDRFAETMAIAQKSGVSFCYAISFGRPLDFVSAREFELVTSKLGAFFERGCRAFAVLLDDLTPEAADPGQRPPASAAAADADFANRLHVWLQSLDPACSFYVCPTEYHGRPPFSAYLHELGAALHPDIDVFYTGPEICSRQIRVEDVAAYVQAVGRRPLIWDNYPVNDIDMRSEMHLGPLRGRDPLLYAACKGYVANLMNEMEASKVALLTAARYLCDPHHYDPRTSWADALRKVTEEDSYEPLRCFAENSLASCLQPEAAPELDRRVTAAVRALKRGAGVSTSRAVRDLADYLDLLDTSTYHLRNRMPNLALRHELIPWIDALDEQIWMGRGALECLDAMQQGTEWQAALRTMEGRVAEVRRSPKRIGGSSLLALAEFVRECARQRTRATLRPVQLEFLWNVARADGEEAGSSGFPAAGA